MRLAINGRIDTVTSHQLSAEIDKASQETLTTLVMDFREVDYISSAGLRVVITTQKMITSRGLFLELSNMNDTVRSVFDITGFSQIMKIT
jgi:anti-sigma B factor antagonist